MEIVALITVLIVIVGFFLGEISERLAEVEGRTFFPMRWFGYITISLILLGTALEEPASFATGVLFTFPWMVFNIASLAMYVVDIKLMNPRSANSFNHEGL